MTKLITLAVFNGTKMKLAVSGNTVDSVMAKLAKDKVASNACAFLFFSRKTGNIIESRVNR